MIATTNGRAESVLDEMRRVMREGVAYTRLVDAWLGVTPRQVLTRVDGDQLHVEVRATGRLGVFTEAVDGTLGLVRVVGTGEGSNVTITLPVETARVGAVWLPATSRARSLLRVLEAGEELSLHEIRPLLIPRAGQGDAPTDAPAS